MTDSLSLHDRKGREGKGVGKEGSRSSIHTYLQGDATRPVDNSRGSLVPRRWMGIL